MNQVKQTLRRSGISIMAHLISLLGSFAAVLILAVINGSIGYLCAMSVTLFGALGVAKALGEPIWLSYEWIIALAVGCGILRGLLRYIEQYSNHYIAFHLLAILRDKIFGVLRKLCPAKLESKQKGSIIAMLTSDIETLEVFYAHTLSPICIAILVSFSVCLFTWLAASPWLALVALIGYLVIGIVVPMISSAALKEITDGKNITYENLEVRKLSFAYQKNEPVLKDVCMQAQKGEIVGIIGESGCGKSTLLKLLLRFWSKDSGEILFNGTDIEKINSDNLLDNVTMVSQVTYLFDDTIEENLRIAKPDATQVEMEQACRLASVHDFVMSLPNGYQTRVGAMGDALSSGEKQRLGLARAFLSGRQLILLDEPTSNVDSINEGIILKALAQQKSKKSIILVSHRESTMAIADRIYKVENGYMTEATK